MWPRFPDWTCNTKPEPYPVRVLPRPTETFGTINKVKVGPNAIGNSEGKLNTRYWICYQESGFVSIRSAVDADTWSSPIILFEETEEIDILDFSFDQLGREVVFYKVGTELRLWFFDSSAIPSGYVKIVLIANGNWPHVNFDLIYDTSDPLSDVILCYVKNNSIYKRIQRDRYEIEYPTGVSHEGVKIESAGLNKNNKFQIVYIYKDLRDGGMKPKVYETTTNVFKQLQYNNLEIGFTLAETPTDCDLKKLGQIYYTLVSNFGFVYGNSVGPENNERSLIVRFAYNDFDDSVTLQILRDDVLEVPEGLTGAYYEGILSDFRFDSGNYVIKFTQEDNSPTIPTKRLELIKNGVTIIDEIVLDLKSRDGGFEAPSVINKLRFGADCFTAFPTTTTYRYPYPVKFLNMYSIFNGVRTDWPLSAGVSDIVSVPAGNNIVVKFKDSDEPGWAFDPFTPIPLP